MDIKFYNGMLVLVKDGETLVGARDINGVNKYLLYGQDLVFDYDGSDIKILGINPDILKKEIVNVANRIEEHIFNKVLGYKNDTKQLRRYELKYERAKAGYFSKEKNEAIISKYESNKALLEGLVLTIEELREFFSDEVDAGRIEQLYYLLHKLDFDIQHNQNVVSLDNIKAIHYNLDTYIASEVEEIKRELVTHMSYLEKQKVLEEQETK